MSGVGKERTAWNVWLCMQEMSSLFVCFSFLKMGIITVIQKLAIQAPRVVCGESWTLPEGACTLDPSISMSPGDQV